MLQNLIDSLRVLADLFRAHPVPFTLGAVAFVTLSYYKWIWIARASRTSVENSYAGWRIDGTVDEAQRLVMRPLKLRSIALWNLAFFGSGAVFFAFAVLPNKGLSLENMFAFGAASVFSVLAVWLFFMSFTKITFDGEVFTRTGPATRAMVGRMDQLDDIRPIRKTIANGVYLHFRGAGWMRVAAYMSGYGQLVQLLMQDQPKMRMLVRANAQAANREA